MSVISFLLLSDRVSDVILVMQLFKLRVDLINMNMNMDMTDMGLNRT